MNSFTWLDDSNDRLNNYAYVRPMTRKQLALSPIIKSNAE